MKPWQTPGTLDEGSAGALARILARGVVNTVRGNKLASTLAAVALVTLGALAVDDRFDGRSEYRQTVLPQLLRLETGFQNRLRAAERAEGDWRRYYFREAHSLVRDILRAADVNRPRAYVARGKHNAFLRYYTALDAEFHRLEKRSASPAGIAELRRHMDRQKPQRDAWARWAVEP